MNNIKVSKNFKLREFECKDGSNTTKIDSNLLNKLQLLRDTINKPILINSAYRSQNYNKKVGGSPRSQHMLGKAVDIKVNGLTPTEVAKKAEETGFNGIGIYKTFVHLDVRAIKTRWRG